VACVVGEDHAGVYAVVECDTAGCWAHVSLRPAAGQSAYDTLCAAFDIAEDDGWLLIGRAYCPRHAPVRRSRTAGRVGEAFRWADVSNRRPRQVQRPS